MFAKERPKEMDPMVARRNLNQSQKIETCPAIFVKKRTPEDRILQVVNKQKHENNNQNLKKENSAGNQKKYNSFWNIFLHSTIQG